MFKELKLSKSDPKSHWGFRLIGGADYQEPLVVVKVSENSFAENAGLMVGDIVVRINNTSTAGMTHACAHDLISLSGTHFMMAVRRGLFSDLPMSSEEESNAEIEDILKQVPEKELGAPPTILESLAGQVEGAKTNGGGIQRATKNKKWSTFLVKPKNQKPVDKNLQEERQITGEPYRVKIVKQPRRDPQTVLNKRKSVQFEPLVTQVEISRDTSTASTIDSLEVFDDSIMDGNDSPVEIDDSSVVTEEDNDNPPIIEEQEEIITKNKSFPLDIHIDPVVRESSLSLEAQLAAVQKQLLALSQLPSAIQVTLEAVTQQLNKIVLEKDIQIEETTIIEEEEEKSSSNAEGDITDNEDNNTVLEDEEVVNGDEPIEEEIEAPQIEDEAPIEESPPEPYAGLTEEEKEAKIQQELLEAKRLKIEEERRKMDWTQRPIVLPGGRRWCDEEDAEAKLRQPRMSDAKICKTIEDHSEVERWNLMWPWGDKDKKPIYSINFLKFQPPAKNLDYLQKSEVYRLIHDMEPPRKGVEARAEKILSEKDYYGDKGAP